MAIVILPVNSNFKCKWIKFFNQKTEWLNGFKKQNKQTKNPTKPWLVGTSSCKPKVVGSIPVRARAELWVWAQVVVPARGNQSMFLSLPLSSPPV